MSGQEKPLPLPCTADFRDALHSLIPELWDRDRLHIGLVMATVSDLHRDPKGIIVSATRVARLSGMVGRFTPKKYNSFRPLKEFCKDTGTDHRLFAYPCCVRSFAPWECKARVLEFKHSKVLQQFALAENLTRPKSGHDWMRKVDVVSGLKLGARDRRLLLDAAEAEAASRLATHNLTEDQRAIASAFNRLDPNVFQLRLTRNLIAAHDLAMQLPRDKRSSACSALNQLVVQPKPFYWPSSFERSSRLFSSHPWHQIPSDIRRVLTAGDYEVDLQSCHLAIVAVRWNVPLLEQFLTDSARSIWIELADHFGLDPTARVKKILKHELLYPLTYGRTVTQAAYKLRTKLGLQGDLASRILAHPLLGTLIDARDRMCAKIEAAGSFLTAGGRTIKPGQQYYGGKRTPASILSEDAQDIELALVRPIVEVAKVESKMRLLLHQHDGMTISIRERSRVLQIMRRVNSAVDEVAKHYKVQTKLEWKECGKAGD